MVRLGRIVQDVLDSESLAYDAAAVSFVADIAPELTLRCDPEQLFRVILNLVRNAREAIIGSGQPGEISVSGHAEETDWVIEIADTGPGLPAKARENLFKPFQGGVRKGGSGLGLAIVAELVRGHGGVLVLKSSDDMGTRFQIRLPMGDAI